VQTGTWVIPQETLLVRTTWQAGKPEKHTTSAGNFCAILYGFSKNGKKNGETRIA
jgi:hypothetical protein